MESRAIKQWHAQHTTTLSSIINRQTTATLKTKTHIQVMIDSSPWYRIMNPHSLNKRTLTQVTYTPEHCNHC